jgi:hypothetical protein
VTSCGSCRLNFALGAQLTEFNQAIVSLVELAADQLPADGPQGQASWRRPG